MKCLAQTDIHMQAMNLASLVELHFTYQDKHHSHTPLHLAYRSGYCKRSYETLFHTSYLIH